MPSEQANGGDPDERPLFFYDFSSPYSYLSAFRVDRVLPREAKWQPVVFGALMGAIGKVSWSLQKGADRDSRMRECERRASALGLPLRWPSDWPIGTYSTLAVRAAVVADEYGRLREFSQAAFRVGLGAGGDLRDLDVILGAAAEAGLEPDVVGSRVAKESVKTRCRDITRTAVKLGVSGVPSVVAEGEIFWGDDRLEEGALALRRAQSRTAVVVDASSLNE